VVTVIFIVFFVVVILLPIALLVSHLRNDDVVAGASFGRQIFGRKDKQREI